MPGEARIKVIKSSGSVFSFLQETQRLLYCGFLKKSGLPPPVITYPQAKQQYNNIKKGGSLFAALIMNGCGRQHDKPQAESSNGRKHRSRFGIPGQQQAYNADDLRDANKFNKRRSQPCYAGLAHCYQLFFRLRGFAYAGVQKKNCQKNLYNPKRGVHKKGLPQRCFRGSRHGLTYIKKLMLRPDAAQRFLRNAKIGSNQS